MKSFNEWRQEEQQLVENPIVDFLGKLWLGAVGATTGAGAGAVKATVKGAGEILGGAAKGAYHGFADEDPFSQVGVQKFKASMKDLQELLGQLPPEEAEQFKQQICGAIQQM